MGIMNTNRIKSGTLVNGTMFTIDAITVNGNYTFGRVSAVTTWVSGGTCSAATAVGKWVALKSTTESDYCVIV